MTSMPSWRVEVTCDDGQVLHDGHISDKTDTNLSFSQVEEWLDDHQENAVDYFLRKMDITFINRWLMIHGFLSIREYVSSRRNSETLANSDEPSPVERASGYFSDGPDTTSNRRTNSKKYLRQKFARSKKIGKQYKCEKISQSADSPTHVRRSSLRDLRRFLSLPSRSIYMLNLLTESKVRIPRLPSKGLDSKRELRFLNERQFFLESVQEIAHDLNVTSLTHKITTNLAVFVDSDCASLFLVEGTKDRRLLVSRRDSGIGSLMINSGKNNQIKVPLGAGITGHVATTGESVNLIDAYEDPRYNDEVDRIYGHKTASFLCMPVRNADDEIIGVAQAINKSGKQQFTTEDQKLAKTYLEFCGIALTNAKLFEMSQKEYERNRSLLEVVHDLFEEQTSLEKVILKIMQRAQRLLKCERAAVLLLVEGSDNENVKFSKTFELSSPPLAPMSPDTSFTPEPQSETSTELLRFAKRVASTGEVLNVSDPIKIPEDSGRHIRSLLCMPVRERNYKIIGVATIINRTDGLLFDENDEQLFEAFTLFCGLGINNTLMYSELEKAMARQKVAIEVISYHATATPKDIKKYLDRQVAQVSSWQLRSTKFDDFSLTSDEMVIAAIQMFEDLDLLSKFNIDETNCGLKSILTELEVLGMMVGCLCHDLDHRGTNNAFQEKSGSALALLYGNKATMEQHHFNHAVMILSSEGHNIFESLSSDDYSRVMNVLKNAILATDLSTYFQ
ncbi:dual 3',5'-cyclic-AMP and -GMP phosphodiesterase 11A-like isoform X2 [Tachypleus tridentatus]|uniref:dual 3',5'-cyclic-AMP and -GMP phosphodiesterase 11A-like isoform X2 n=1 Tax=Tachypleus tridentatus TaxID=6853 RepID=UPI003FD2E8C2